MPKFSNTSLERLRTCHQDLQTIFHYVIKYMDCTVVCGHRNKKDQDDVFEQGFSKVKWPNSKHNSMPSMAVDVVPYPVDWYDRERFKHFAGFVKGVAQMLKDYGAISNDIEWGGDWKFVDMPHYQLAE